jgi:hypothetical protein
VDTRFIDRHRKRLSYLLKNVPVDPSGSLEVQAHWARYTCIVMSGYIEDCVKELLSAYTNERSAGSVFNYVSAQLKFFRTADVDNISELVAKFDKNWSLSFASFLTPERKDAVNSVVGNRHRIAHGLDVSVTISQLSQWYPKINDVIDHLTELCNNH